MYEKYHDDLVKTLPMNDETFQEQLADNKILPHSVKAHINNLPTQSDKAKYFLESVIKPSIVANYTGAFYSLLEVMKNCEYPHVERLAAKIESDLEKELKGN